MITSAAPFSLHAPIVFRPHGFPGAVWVWSAVLARERGGGVVHL